MMKRLIDPTFLLADRSSAGEAGTPVRFVTLLAPGQSVTLSSAGEKGSAPASVEFTHQHHQIFVHEAVAAN